MKAKAEAFARSRRGKRWLKGARIAFILAVAGWLAYQLSDIGWADVWAERPRTPWFYVLWAVLYIQLPLVEAGIYRALWGLPVREGLVPLFRKRALNHDVAGYSGEAYFFTWVRRRLALPAGRIAGTLKDNAIASSLGSWTAVLLMVGAFLVTGHIVLADLIGLTDPMYVAVGGVGAAVLIGLGVRFRRTLLTLRPRTVGVLFAAHLGRHLLLVYVLRILQWAVVLPDAPLSVWATMLAVMALISRLPLIPARDLVGTSVVLSMAGLLPASGAALAAMLLMHSALSKAANFLLFVVLGAVPQRRSPAKQPAEQAPDVPGVDGEGDAPPGESPVAPPREKRARKGADVLS